MASKVLSARVPSLIDPVGEQLKAFGSSVFRFECKIPKESSLPEIPMQDDPMNPWVLSVSAPKPAQVIQSLINVILRNHPVYECEFAESGSVDKALGAFGDPKVKAGKKPEAKKVKRPVSLICERVNLFGNLGVSPSQISDWEIPQFAVLMAAAFHPKWVESIDGETIPGVYLSGIRFRTRKSFGYLCMTRNPHTGVLRIRVEPEDFSSDQIAVPVYSEAVEAKLVG